MLKLFCIPALYVVQKPMSSQYIDDLHRFVQIDLIQVVDLTGQHCESKKLPGYVKGMQKTGEWNEDLFVVMVNKFVVQNQLNTAQAQFIPTHSSKKYGLLIYDEVHSPLAHFRKLWLRVQHQESIHARALCSTNPQPDQLPPNHGILRKSAGHHGRGKRGKPLLNKDRRSPLLTKWRDEVLKPASKRNEHLVDGQETHNKSGKLLIQLAIGKTL
ncbi:Helicase [Pseudozyma hubeiensis]|nr:Helicase [Pseudozyma hubeiensis]